MTFEDYAQKYFSTYQAFAERVRFYFGSGVTGRRKRTFAAVDPVSRKRNR